MGALSALLCWTTSQEVEARVGRLALTIFHLPSSLPLSLDTPLVYHAMPRNDAGASRTALFITWAPWWVHAAPSWLHQGEQAPAFWETGGSGLDHPHTSELAAAWVEATAPCMRKPVTAVVEESGMVRVQDVTRVRAADIDRRLNCVAFAREY